MTIKKNQKYEETRCLLILSIPFQRLIRSHLSPMMMNVLTNKGDVVVVSPFSRESLFIKEYIKGSTKAILPPNYDNLSWLSKKFITITNELRVQGYHFRRRKDIPFYWTNRFIRFGENGTDYRYGFFRRIAINIIGFFGAWSRSWRIIDSLHGSISYHFPGLIELAYVYKKVILIQSSTWGFQDQALGYWARKLNWVSAMFPYTYDQLFCNGWLFCDYDKIFLQGEAELNFAKSFHNIPCEKLIHFGSLNALSIVNVNSKVINKNKKAKPNNFNIMFAGSTPTYYPTKSELQCIELLLKIASSGIIENLTITYRLISPSDETIELINSKYGHLANFKISVADPSIYNLEKFENIKWLKMWQQHIRSLKCDLMISAGVTSLSLDMAYLDIPSIAVFIDESGVLKSRNIDLTYELYERHFIRIIKKEDELFNEIQTIYSNFEYRESIVNETKRKWGFTIQNLKKTIENNLF